MNTSNSLVAMALEAVEPAVRRTFEAVSRELDLPIVEPSSRAFPLLLVATSLRWEIRDVRPGGVGPVFVDFTRGAADYRRQRGGGRRQLIARAIGLEKEPLTVIDATAGLGRDAFALACLGCEVTAVERSEVLAVLLSDGLKRAADCGREEIQAVARRMTLLADDAREVLGRLTPDVVYLDPMYPTRKKQAPLVKKEMRICRTLAGDDDDAAELLSLAMKVARRRVVVKRSIHAPRLGEAPTIRLVGKKTRYDIYVVQRQR